MFFGRETIITNNAFQGIYIAVPYTFNETVIWERFSFNWDSLKRFHELRRLVKPNEIFPLNWANARKLDLGSRVSDVGCRMWDVGWSIKWQIHKSL